MHKDAIIPAYATEGAAAFDLHCINDGLVLSKGSDLFKTGLAFEIPEGYVMLVTGRSGYGFKHGVRLANCVGVIDSDYRGEVLIKLVSDGDTDLFIEPRERIAQAMIVPIQQVTFDNVDELSSTERGDGGFGSTGLK